VTRFALPDGQLYIKWDQGDPVDWTTPNAGDGIAHEWCGNCGLDVPGCGCPRDPDFDPVNAAQLAVQGRDDPPIERPSVAAEAKALGVIRDD
jgi:hypothetical protein